MKKSCNFSSQGVQCLMLHCVALEATFISRSALKSSVHFRKNINNF